MPMISSGIARLVVTMRHGSSSNMRRVPWTFCASVFHPCASYIHIAVAGGQPRMLRESFYKQLLAFSCQLGFSLV